MLIVSLRYVIELHFDLERIPSLIQLPHHPLTRSILQYNQPQPHLRIHCTAYQVTSSTVLAGMIVENKSS